MTNYYFGNPQLYKMPKQYRGMGPSLTPSAWAQSGVPETMTNIVPILSLGVAGYIAYRMLFK